MTTSLKVNDGRKNSVRNYVRDKIYLTISEKKIDTEEIYCKTVTYLEKYSRVILHAKFLSVSTCIKVSKISSSSGRKLALPQQD